MIKMLADEELKVKLAFLHSAIEAKRNEIMPFSDKFPLTDIMEALQYWYKNRFCHHFRILCLERN
jgi:23S rRNA (adenine2503-C2)-methyltransferase